MHLSQYHFDVKRTKMKVMKPYIVRHEMCWMLWTDSSHAASTKYHI